MINKYIKYFLPLSIVLFTTLTSCKKVFEEDNYTAYFGGEILNPQDKFVLFMKDNEVIDTIYLDKNKLSRSNTFYIQIFDTNNKNVGKTKSVFVGSNELVYSFISTVTYEEDNHD